uniref:Uncharacterized protein n=1 Tax=Caenorhabditis tropicalis TaxID=1561998 RepID=A0A1I7T469_9PELO
MAYGLATVIFDMMVKLIMRRKELEEWIYAQASRGRRQIGVQDTTHDLRIHEHKFFRKPPTHTDISI